MMDEKVRISHASSEGFVRRVLEDGGARDDVARAVAEGLVHASLRGVDSHGVRLLPHYVRELEGGRINPDPDFHFEKGSATSGVLDGDHTYGHAAGRRAVAHAVELARESGIGAVAVKNSSHFGAASFFGLEIAENDLIGLSLTNTDSLIVSHGSRRPFLGNNPICVTAPVEGEGPFCLDMATSKITFNRVLELRNEGQEAPPGSGVDGQGRATRDPDQIEALLPIGAYKGFGLALVVEILCGVLTGMPWGRHIPKMYEASLDQERYLGHFFLALDPEGFLPVQQFETRLADLLEELRSEPPVDPEQPVRVAGDPEKETAALRREEGIPVSATAHSELRALAEETGIAFPEVVG